MDIIYQDSYILAVNKPAGIIIHSDGTFRASKRVGMCAAETLTDHVRVYLENNGCMQQAQDAQALHRLDKDTTGIVLFSLDKETQPLFDELIRSRNVHKTYLAVVKGEFPEGEQDITLPIGRDRHDARRMRVSKTGKPALTHVRRLEVQRRGQSTQSLMLAELGTGRKHQIRVHFSALGFPIVGDGLYGRTSSTRTAAFTQVPLMLHAYELSFMHPVTGESLVLKTGWPPRFTGWSVQNP
ncbi:RluA family pseudouridine synthase [Lancefieldella rimae]|uniref:RluA family pseudouridine synthase n=1 Tax=Lancefieldella rimae TaxID=1383 RepID=UPI003A8E5122